MSSGMTNGESRKNQMTIQFNMKKTINKNISVSKLPLANLLAVATQTWPLKGCLQRFYVSPKSKNTNFPLPPQSINK